MANIEIDGKKVQAEAGQMIIQVTDKLGVEVPRFCYHDRLKIAANCRMCLVEIDKSRKPVPACATPITEGMKIFTQSAMARDAQRAVMEFLLINHPLDCPICDQGGECELQDLSLSYGDDISRFTEGKRAVTDENLGPLVATEMTRCIACTRCVRFGEEIAGLRELGAVGRGEDIEIKTYVNKSLVSELSGNIIDLCPVGALTARPSRFTARAWELAQFKAIAPHDCVGSNIYLHARRGEIMRVVPCENDKLNEVWISDRDRFSYVALKSPQRSLSPKIKQDNGEWIDVSWQEGLAYVNKKIHELLLAPEGPSAIGALISSSSTTEELYLWQKMWRKLGVQNIDHRLKEQYNPNQIKMPLYPGLTCSLQNLEQQENFLLIGSYSRKEQPLLNHRIRKAQSLTNAKIFVLNAIDYEFNFDITEKIITTPEYWTSELTGILSALLQQLPNHDTRVKNLLDDHCANLLFALPLSTNRIHQHIAIALLNSDSKTILLGTQALHAKQFDQLWDIAQLLARLCGANIGVLSDGANSAGGWLTGAIPHRLPGGIANPNIGLSAAQQFDNPLSAYFLFQCEPEFDSAQPGKAIAALHKAKMVVNFTTFESEKMYEYSHVILPICSYAENVGSYINIMGLQQNFAAAIASYADSKPGWKVITELAQLAKLEGFIYPTTLEITNEIKQQFPPDLSLSFANIPQGNISEKTFFSTQVNNNVGNGITPLAEWPSYRIDSYVRRSHPLQCAASHDPCVLKMHPVTAEYFNLKEGNQVVLKQENVEINAPLILDERLPKNTFWLPMGYKETMAVWDTHAPFFISNINKN